jgi:23S rRNA (guanosine2251-2'-O)-methyltransferase
MGSEGAGLRPRVASACDALVSLPIRGRIDSLSVGAAAAVLLYAAGARRESAAMRNEPSSRRHRGNPAPGA